MRTARAARAVAAVLLAVTAGCGRSGGSGGGAGSGAVTSQQAGGDTAWLSATFQAGADVRALTPLPDGRVAVEIAPAVGGGAGGTSLASVDDPASPIGWSATLASSCAVDARPVGITASGALAVTVTSGCGDAVSGLAPDPVASGSIVLVNPATGAYTGSISAAGVVGGSGIAAAATSSGELAIFAESSGAVLDVAEDGDARWRWDLEAVHAIAGGPAGDVIVAFGSGIAQLQQIGRDGSGGWYAELPATFSLRGLAVLTDGAIAALGTVEDHVTWGRGGAGQAGSTRAALLVLEPDGSPRTAADVADATPGRDALLVASLPHGRVLVSGFAQCDRVRALSPQLDPVWERTVDANCRAHVHAATLSAAGQVLVAGSFQGRADFGAGHVIDSAGGADAPFVLALWP